MNKLYFFLIPFAIFIKNVDAEVTIAYCKEIDNATLNNDKQIDIISNKLANGVITQSQAISQINNLNNNYSKINKKYGLTNDNLAIDECDSIGYKFKDTTLKRKVGYNKCSQKYSGSEFNSCASKVWESTRD